jgi:hypothetical protein
MSRGALVSDEVLLQTLRVTGDWETDKYPLTYINFRVDDECGDKFFFLVNQNAIEDDVLDQHIKLHTLFTKRSLAGDETSSPYRFIDEGTFDCWSFLKRVNWCYDHTLMRNSSFNRVFLLGTISRLIKPTNESLIRRLSGHYAPLTLIAEFVGVLRGEELRFRSRIVQKIREKCVELGAE